MLDPESTLARFEGSTDLLKQVLSIFQREATDLLPRIGEAIKAQDGPRLCKASHRLRGSLVLFGPHPACDAALQLEIIGRHSDFTGAAEARADLEEQIHLLTLSLERMV